MLAPVTWQDAPRQYPGQPRVLWLLGHYVVCTQVPKVPLRDKLCPFLLSSRCSSQEASGSLLLSLYFPLFSINSALRLCLHGHICLLHISGPLPLTWEGLSRTADHYVWCGETRKALPSFPPTCQQSESAKPLELSTWSCFQLKISVCNSIPNTGRISSIHVTVNLIVCLNVS